MKSFLLVFVLSLLSLSKENCIGIAKPSKDACNNGLTDDDKKHFERCCYAKYRLDGYDTDTEECLPLTKYKFEHVKDAIDDYQFKYSGTFVIECKADYIKFGLLSLALLFI